MFVESQAIDYPTLASLTSMMGQDGFQNFALVILLVVFFMIVKSWLMNCPLFDFIHDEPLKDAVYVLFREAIIVISGSLGIEGLKYYEVINFNKDTEIGLSYCIMMIVCLWTAVGFIMVISAQK